MLRLVPGWIFALCLVSTFSSPVAAQIASPSPEAQAEALIRHGVALRSAGHDDEALTEFQRANAIHASPRALAQIGLAEQAIGHWLDADQHVRAALAATTDPWIQHNRAALEGAMDVIAHRLGSLDVRGGVAGAEIWIDNRRVGTLPLQSPIRVLPGSVSFEVRAPGFITRLRTVIVDPGGLAREDVQLEPVPSTAVASASPSPAPSGPIVTPATRGPTISPFVWVGAVAVVVGVGGALGVLAGGDAIQGAYNHDCVSMGVASPSCAARYSSDQSTLNALSAVGDVLVGVSVAGAVALVLGVVRSDFHGGEHGHAARQPRMLMGARGMGVQFTW